MILAGLVGQSMAASTFSDKPSVAVVDQRIADSALTAVAETRFEVAEARLLRQPACNLLSGVSTVTSTSEETANQELPVDKDEIKTGNQMPVSRGLASYTVAADAGDVELLARAIYAEARGEPFLGQVAVGAVIINRVKHKGFPSTVRGVIYQPGALCTVKDGQINLKPGETARRAALLALSGVDPTDGSLYFYNPAYATAKWTKKKPVTAEIGNHVFAR